VSLDCTIRRARTEDLPDIVRMLRDDALREKSEDLGPPLPQEYLDAFASMDRDENNRLMVAEVEGRVAGTFQLTIIQHLMYRGGRIAQIEAVRVDRPLRGHGIGERMMLWAIDDARARGCARVQLTTNKERTDAHRFYERLGFKPTHVGMKLFLG